MSATTCPRCGRERGIRHSQCHPDELAECLGEALARVERERDEARSAAEQSRAALAYADRAFDDLQQAYIAVERERDEARDKVRAVASLRAQVVRLRRAARLDMKRRMQLAAALGKRGFKREPMGRRGAMLGWRHLLDQVQSAVARAERGCATVYNLGGLKARGEADAMRELAWRWCIGAARETERRREVEAERDKAATDSVRHYYEVMACARGEESALAEADAMRELAWSWCIDCKACADYGYHALGDVLRLRADVDELRALAWEWCIEARSGREELEPHEREWSEMYAKMRLAEEERDELRAQLERLTDDAYEVDHRGRNAEQAGPLPTAVLADSTDEEPIDSLGPVPVWHPKEESWETFVERLAQWLVHDDVRRGAKLEGDDQ
jgi:hypothetical protein